MAILINGNGNPAIYPDQDADWFASIFGGQTAITGVGSQFAAAIEDANTIAVADGVIITKEGRRIQLDANQSDIFEIPTGAQGTTNYYIIGYCLTTNDDSSQTAETFVQLMENATDTIEEDTFRDGADKVYVSLYRVTQTGFNLETPELLLPKVESITQLNADLTDLSTKSTVQTLWTNDSPSSSSFSAQTVSLSPNTCSVYIIECIDSHNPDTYVTAILIGKGIPNTIIGMRGSGAENSYRNVTINADNTVSFGDCYISHSVYNDYIIPNKIYGLL